MYLLNGLSHRIKRSTGGKNDCSPGDYKRLIYVNCPSYCDQTMSVLYLFLHPRNQSPKTTLLDSFIRNLIEKLFREDLLGSPAAGVAACCFSINLFYGCPDNACYYVVPTYTYPTDLDSGT